jgi:hypothetical protein
MNERTIQLYKQAQDFAYTTAGKDAGKGTIIESLTAGKFAELIVRECIWSIQSDMDRETMNGTISLAKHAGMVSAKTVIKKHFGVEE